VTTSLELLEVKCLHSLAIEIQLLTDMNLPKVYSSSKITAISHLWHVNVTTGGYDWWHIEL